jgi:tRNA (cytidine/uridine-2'-O-)-methyltransferase
VKPETPERTGLNIVLVQPQIPPNTGNVARLCAAIQVPLFLVGELGFEISNRYLKRAGLDYWHLVDVRICPDEKSFFSSLSPADLYLFTKRAPVSYTDCQFKPGDCLVFGSETQGLPGWLLSAYPERQRRIPMRSTGVRSINLSSAVAIVAYEAARQIDLFSNP